MKRSHLFLGALLATPLLLPASALGAAGAQSQAAPKAAAAPAGAAAAGIAATRIPRVWVPSTPGAPGTGRASQPEAAPGVAEGEVAHAKPPAPPPPPEPHRLILRNGSILLARDEPKLVGGTVRFTDQRGTLVSVRASEVDQQATAAANRLHAGAAPAPKVAPARPPAPAPKAVAARPPAR